jgi:hypothetical protein
MCQKKRGVDVGWRNVFIRPRPLLIRGMHRVLSQSSYLLLSALCGFNHPALKKTTEAKPHHALFFCVLPNSESDFPRGSANPK